MNATISSAMTNAGVKVWVEGDKLVVASPFHPDFPDQARNAGGKWSAGSSAWLFDPRNRDKVEKVLISVYGSVGESVPACDVGLTIGPYPFKEPRFQSGPASFYALGRLIAKRSSRDSAIRLGEGVTLEKGKLPSFGGSAKYPELALFDGTVFLIRDVPITIAEKAAAKYGGVEIVGLEISDSEPEIPEKTVGEHVLDAVTVGSAEAAKAGNGEHPQKEDRLKEITQIMAIYDISIEDIDMYIHTGTMEG